MKAATRILREVRSDADEAAERLLPLVYSELRRVAGNFMQRERLDHTLQPTALVHEAYFKLIDDPERTFENRAHFLAVGARAMRQVLVDHARRRAAGKRGPSALRVTLSERVAATGAPLVEVLAMHEALEKLGEQSSRLARVVELRYFGGLTIRETSEVIGVSHATVEEDWSLAKAWLARELSKGVD